MAAKDALGAAAIAAGLSPWLCGVAGAQTLDIELNKLEDIQGRCAASLLLTNRMGDTLDQVRFDLYIFDQAGVISRRLLLDTGPMRVDKTVVATFGLTEGPCSAVGRLLINDVPVCKSAAGLNRDCVAALDLSSRAAVPLTK